MIVASGFVETNEIEDVKGVVSELKIRGVEVNEIKDEKIVFLIERESASEIEKLLESLKNITGVRNVYLAYFSIEGSDEVANYL
jgi:nitrate reductase NapAB chaperone NapD